MIYIDAIKEAIDKFEKGEISAVQLSGIMLEWIDANGG